MVDCIDNEWLFLVVVCYELMFSIVFCVGVVKVVFFFNMVDLNNGVWFFVLIYIGGVIM